MKKNNNLLAFGLLGLGAYLFLNPTQKREATFLVPGKGYIPESQLAQYGYYYYPPARGYVPLNKIIAFYVAGGKANDNPTGSPWLDPKVWDSLFDGILDVYETWNDMPWNENNSNQAEIDASIDWDGTYARQMKIPFV